MILFFCHNFQFYLSFWFRNLDSIFYRKLLFSGSISNASNDSKSDESFDLLATFNSLDDFFSSGIPGNVLPDFCSSLCNSHIPTPAFPFYFCQTFRHHLVFPLPLRFLSPSLLYLSLNATNFFSLLFHHTLPVHTEHTLLQNFLAPARGSFFLGHMCRVVPYPLLSFSLCKHNHPL